MKLDKDIADQMFKAKVFFAHNTAAPSENKYGWLVLPSEINVAKPITIEERVGLYGGIYRGSIGAPKSHGLCTVGAFTYSYSPVPAGLVIGRYCSFSNGLKFLDSHHQTHLLTTSAITFRPRNELWRDILEATGNHIDKSWHIYNYKNFPVIGNDVWIGRDVTLAMGITIGDGAIIAANSVVTKDVPPYTIFGGNPAGLLRMRFPTEIALRLHSSEWWNKAPEFVARIASYSVEDALDHIEKFGNDVGQYKPTTFTLSNEGLQVRDQAQASNY